jgi:hypothetical protein
MLIIDTHVHLHPVFDLDMALRSATGHMEHMAGGATFRAVLCLVDPAWTRNEVRLLEESTEAPGAWQFRRDEAAKAIVAANDRGSLLYLLPGRQIISRENLEVLALDVQLEVPDRTRTLEALIDHVLEEGGIPVLPWSFGKWTGARGRVVEAVVRKRRDFVLADNGNRWPNCGEPRLLRLGRDRGLPVWSGSDPLPFAPEASRVGSCGILMDETSAAEAPGKMLRRASAGDPVQTYRTPCSFTRFTSAMLRMQVRKWR